MIRSVTGPVPPSAAARGACGLGPLDMQRGLAVPGRVLVGGLEECWWGASSWPLAAGDTPEESWPFGGDALHVTSVTMTSVLGSLLDGFMP